jgi:OFA family oxalate/formate antiporter-like MFS transporter
MSTTSTGSTTASETHVTPFLSRWSIPIAGLLFTLMGGIAYAWGVFVVPLQEAYGWTRAQAVLPVSIQLSVFVISMIIGGYIQDRRGPRLVAGIGAVLFLIAYLLAMQVDRFPYPWWLVLTYGVIGGLAVGFTYSVAIPTARKWFPDKSALAITVAVTGFGLAATFFAPWITSLIRTEGIAQTFLILGIITCTVSLFATWLVREPSPGWTPPGWTGFNSGTSAAMYRARSESTLPEALRTSFFYVQLVAYFAIIFGGLMAMAHLVPYGRTILGMEAAAAAKAMIFFGLCNGFGRPVAGFLAEKIGPTKVMIIFYSLAGLAFLLFHTTATGPTGLYVNAAIFGMAFAVTLGLMPVLTTMMFGTKHIGAVYGAMFIAFGLGAFFGPMVGGWAFDAAGTYVVPFTLAGILMLVGVAIVIFGFRLKYKLP